MSVASALALIGLAFDVVGAFFLAVEAIGISRLDVVESVAEEGITHLLEGPETAGLKRWRRPLRLLIGLFVFAALPTVALLIPEPARLGARDRWQVILYVFGGTFLGGVNCLVLMYVGAVALQVFAGFLRRTKRLQDARLTGPLGFFLLLIGFSLQFLGTLLQALRS